MSEQRSASEGRGGGAATEPFYSLPNLLTLSRLPLAAAVWWDASDPLFVLGILALAGLSDVFDGRFARMIRRRRLAAGAVSADPKALGGPMATGAWLDPLCDKVFVVSALIAVWVAREQPLGTMLLVGLREILMAPAALLFLALRGRWPEAVVDFRADPWGKATTVAQFAAIALGAFAHPALSGAAAAAGVLGLLAAARYVWRTLRALSQG
ncbi:MAG: hypothetical protein D6729_16870 [Deltaproteobacteria bacterium]|nr:MAG: hypothetical protein D6729_16870 [Deltaproteobacteria bacterium]